MSISSAKEMLANLILLENNIKLAENKYFNYKVKFINDKIKPFIKKLPTFKNCRISSNSENNSSNNYKLYYIMEVHINQPLCSYKYGDNIYVIINDDVFQVDGFYLKPLYMLDNLELNNLFYKLLIDDV